MLRRTRLLLALVVFASLLTACSPEDLVMGCSLVQGSALIPADLFAGLPIDPTAMPLQVQDIDGNVLGSGFLQLTPVDVDNSLLSLHIPVSPAQPEGALLVLVVEGGPGPFFAAPCSSTPITSFNPGDSRVDPQPGDRLAIYCNLPPGSIDVWGVDEESKGFRLATFTLDELKAAGLAGVYKTVDPNGTISISDDGQGNFWAAWNGGQYNATGQPGHGFAKGFRCD